MQCDDAVAVAQRTFGARNSRVSMALGLRASVAIASGNHSKAAEFLRHSLLVQLRCYGPMNPRCALSLRSIGAALEKLNRIADALVLYEQALPILINAYGRSHKETMYCCNEIGTIPTRSFILPDYLHCNDRPLSGLFAQAWHSSSSGGWTMRWFN